MAEELHNILPNMSPDAAGEFVIQASEDLHHAGLVFGEETAIQTAYGVHGIFPEEAHRLQDRVDAIRDLYEALPQLLQQTDISRILGASQQSIDLALESMGQQPAISLLAFDLVKGKIIDPNNDKTDAIGLIDPFQRSFGEAFPQLIGLMHGLDEQIIAHAKELTGKDNPKVFILESATNKFHTPQAAFADAHGFSIGTIADFAQAKGIDIVIRTMGAKEILDNPDTYKQLFAALQQGMPMINPLLASFASNKGLILLLVHKGELPEDWFASAFVVMGEQVLGNAAEGNDLMHSVANNRGEFVIKEAFPGGRVYIGAHDMWKKHTWQAMLQELVASGKPFVIERYLNTPRGSVIVGTRRQVDQPVTVETKQVRPLLKIYSLPGMPLVAEMILGETKNVNGSGYTIPVAFLEKS